MDKTLTTADNQRIAYNHYSKKNQKAVIIAHGFYNSKDAVLLKQLKDCLIGSYDVIGFDFRGHGKSSGLFTWTAKEGMDLQAVIEYARPKYEKLGLISFSLGAAIAINLVAQKDTVNSMVAVSTPCQLKDIDYRFWQLSVKGDIIYNVFQEGRIGKGVRPGPFWLNKLKPIDSVKKLNCPILYIHGKKDWVINYRNSQHLYENTAAKKQLKLIEDGPHAEYLIRDYPEKTISFIKGWFNQTLSGAK